MNPFDSPNPRTLQIKPLGCVNLAIQISQHFPYPLLISQAPFGKIQSCQKLNSLDAPVSICCRPYGDWQLLVMWFTMWQPIIADSRLKALTPVVRGYFPYHGLSCTPLLLPFPLLYPLREWFGAQGHWCIPWEHFEENYVEGYLWSLSAHEELFVVVFHWALNP